MTTQTTTTNGTSFPFIRDQATVKNLAGWTLSPLVGVGSPSGYLPTTTGSLDGASLRGCKSQQYTSWDCLSRSYVCGSTVLVVPRAQNNQRRRRDVVPQEEEEWNGDQPTPDELAALPKGERTMLASGKRFYCREKRGAITPAQLVLQRAVRQRAASVNGARNAAGPAVRSAPPAAAPAAGGAPEPAPVAAPPENGFFYSDTLPVRVMAVSNLITRIEDGVETPFTPVYLQYISRLNDPAQTGVLGATIRGPNVRDSTSMTSLAKALHQRPGTTLELAPMVRSGCALLSLATESYQMDPIRLRFIRNTTPINVPPEMVMAQKPGWDQRHLSITAMPLDTFVALSNNSFFGNVVPGFDYTGLDNDWVAVPVRSALVGQAHLLAYLVSWMSSELWSGTVNHRYRAEADLDDNRKVLLNESYMPACNSVHIPGPYKVAIILVDETADNVCANIRVGTVDVPIWRGRQAVQPADITALWNAYWVAANVNNLRRDFLQAYKEICNKLGVGGACGIASSLIAELYGTLYNGLALDQTPNTTHPDFTQAADGAWTYDGSPLDKTGQIRSQKLDLTEADKASLRRKTVGYNFSSLSPLHQCATGIVRAHYTPRNGAVTLTWGQVGPEFSTPGYNISSMSSLYRVGTYVGLINTHQMSLSFIGPNGFDHWFHMLSCAIAFSSSAFLSLNDLSPREWSGFDMRYSVTHRDTLLADFKDQLFQGLVLHNPISTLCASWGEWDENIISDYYGLDPFDSPDWLTFSPVPYVQTMQWVTKMGMHAGTPNHHPALFRWLGVEQDALQVTTDQVVHKMQMVGTIDVYRYFPQIVCREADSNFRYVKHWFDQTSYYSNVLVNKNCRFDPAYYVSQTSCTQVNTLGLSYTDPTIWYVIGSNYVKGDPQLYAVRVDPIRWPDPPLLETLWNGAKNYILKPAASALTGLFMDGPVGALAAGVGHIAHQVATDLGASTSTKTKLSEVESAARTAMGLGKSPEHNTMKTIPEEKPELKEQLVHSAQGHSDSPVNN